MAFSTTDKIGEIVAHLPKAGYVFKDYDIDFCCGGNRLVCDVAKEQGVDADKLVKEINELYEKVKAEGDEDEDWTTRSMSDLIDHVINKHHAYLQTTLTPLGELVTKILRVHGPHHGEQLLQVHRLYHNLKMEFEEHLIKEEATVFPLIVEYERTQSKELLDKAVENIHHLEEEHDSCGDLLKEIRKVTAGFEVPADGCATYQYTFQKLNELEQDTFVHVHLENNILFPRIHRVQDNMNA
jgi:regulator of cell morphogenesis and NO signaling